MDPTTHPITEAVSTATIAAAKGFFSRIAGPAADELGAYFQDRVRLYRFQNQLRILGHAERLLRESGHEPGEIPLRVLVPLLEFACNEDDPDLATLWANLLATAAVDSTAVPPSYPELLRQLSPWDAQVLGGVPQWTGESTADAISDAGMLLPWGPSPDELAVLLKTEVVEDILFALDNLIGLGLVDREPIIRQTSTGGYIGSTAGRVNLSQLGMRFLAACNAV